MSISSKSLSWAHVSPTPTGRVRLTVYASKLAGLADMNRFANRDEMKSELVSVFDRNSTYESPSDRNARAIDEGLSPEARSTLDATLALLPEMAERGGEAVRVAVASICAAPGTTDEAKEAARSALYTAHGMHGEDAIRRGASVGLGETIRVDNRFRVSKKLFEAGMFDVYVGGRHDGVIGKDRVLTEIKNRVNRWLGVPGYERVQLHAYMAIFGVPSALLVEAFRGEIRHHPVEFDAQLWTSVVERSSEFLTLASEEIL